MTLLRFTPFQKLLRKWESVCPQNGVQAMLVDGALDPDVVELAWQSTLRDLGLGRIHVEEDEGYTHEIWSGDPPAPLVSQLAGEIWVNGYLQEQVNRPFSPAPAMPYRPFALQQGGECYVGIAYQRWVADSVSVRLIMREWFLRIFFPAKARRKLIDLPRLRTITGPEIGLSPRHVARAIRPCYRWLRDRKKFAGTHGFDSGVATLHRFELPAHELDDLLLLARAEGCTLNDLLIAALAIALAPQLGSDNNAGKRVAIATSIDLRPYEVGNVSETFGALLAYAPVICPLNMSNKLDLAQEVGRQTRRLKDPDQIAQILLLPRLLTRWASRREPHDLVAFCRSYMPIAATIANVNLNTSWLALYHPAPVRAYLRVSAPNPAMPFAITTSTLGESFHVTVSACNSTTVDDPAQTLGVAFATALRSLVQSRPPQ